jgi:DNA-binding NarL/FixJ family response regulator
VTNTSSTSNARCREVSVLVVDDEPEVRESIEVILGAEPGLRVIGGAGDGEEALRVARHLRPDVVVMDLRMPVLDGVSATRRIQQELSPPPAVLALTTFATDEMALDAIRAGAGGFCSKADPPAALAEAVRTVARGESIVSPAVLRALLGRLVPPEPAAPADCSARELEVLAIVAEGATNDEVALRLSISEATVRSHLAHLRLKLGARTRAELVVRAWELGLVRRNR